MKNKIRVGIIGGAGYTGGEALRLLLLHPGAEVVSVQSRSKHGNPVFEVHHDCYGLTNLNFTSDVDTSIDILFLCLAHRESKKFLQENAIPSSIIIIDLSQDFRHPENSDFHLRKFIYGLPELNRNEIKKADSIANPGCFATCISLALLPLAANNKIQHDVHISATTGSTGAGGMLKEETNFSWRQNNISPYKIFEHQHLKEIQNSLIQAGNKSVPDIHLVPYRGSFTRGILATLYMESDISEDEAAQYFIDYYKDHPFVHVVPFNIDVKQVVNTNNCFLQIKKTGKELIIISAIDNLLKGAAGQAVQNFNLMFGMEEMEGLRLKASGY